MKKSLPIAVLSLLALVGMSGCGSKTSDTPATESKESSSSEAAIVVSKVEITKDGSALKDDDLEVLDGTSVTLKATVTATGGTKKVDWSVSDSTVAKVVNGVVRFLTVSETKSVTVTATSKDDATKSASVTFTVHHSNVDFSNSRGNNLDTSLYLDEGKVTADPGDIAIVASDIYSTKWYIQADITYTGFSETDNYPKFGIMSGNKPGVWNSTTDSDICYNNFFYLDATLPSSTSTWNTFNVVSQNDTYTDWNWGSQLGGFTATVNKGEKYTIGLLRNGQDYYEFFFNADDESDTPTEVVCMKHFTDIHIAADMATYAWLGGWSTGVEVSNIITLNGDAADAMYGTPESINLGKTEETLYIGDTYQINPDMGLTNYDASKVTYTSSDESVATVDSTGYVVATNKVGSTTITVSYGTLSATMTINVTDDKAFRVVLDGKMDDLIYNDKVKANKYRLGLNGNGEYVDFYGARNSRGIYIYAEQHVNSLKGNESQSDWWENDNFECKFHDASGNEIKGQTWISANKTSNFNDFYVTDPVKADDASNYTITYEAFVSYDDLNGSFDSSSTIAWFVGSNPSSGWKESPYNVLFITSDGIAHGSTTNYCGDGNHEYGDWIVSKENTCGAAGEHYKVCKYCADKVTEEIPADSTAHVYDTSKGTVKTVATCSTDGIVECACEVCGNKADINIGKNRSNHESYSEADKKCTKCGETVMVGDKLDLDKSNADGPYTDTVTFQHAISGDFTAVIKTSNTTTTNGTAAGDNVWRTTFPVVFDADNHANAAFFRWDWCQFAQGTGFTGGENTGMWKDDDNNSFDFNTEMFTLITSFTTETTITRVGNVLTISSIIHPTAEAYASRNFHYTSTINVSATSLDLALGGEYAKGYVELVSIK